MKYSQAVLVACIGGTTLASAASTSERYPVTSAAASRAAGVQGARTFDKAAVFGARGGPQINRKLGPVFSGVKRPSGNVARNVESPASVTPSAAGPMPPGYRVSGGRRLNGRRTRFNSMPGSQDHIRAAVPPGASVGGSASVLVASRNFEEDVWARDFEDVEFLSSRALASTTSSESAAPDASAPIHPMGVHHHRKHFPNGQGKKEELRKAAKQSALKEKAGLRKEPGSAGMPAGGMPSEESDRVVVAVRDFTEDLDARNWDSVEEDLWVRASDSLEFLSSRGEMETNHDASKDKFSPSKEAKAAKGKQNGGQKGAGSNLRNDKPAGTATPTGSVPDKSDPPPPYSPRNFEEDLWARDVDDVEFLSSRALPGMQGPASTTSGSAALRRGKAWRTRGQRKQYERKKSEPAMLTKTATSGEKPDNASMPAGGMPSEESDVATARDFIEDLDARNWDFEIDELD